MRILKYALACLLMLTLVLLIFPARGHAADSTGENITWNLNGGRLTISGTGAIQESSAKSWSAYHNVVKEVVIEPGITALCEGAFQNFTALTSVTVPEGFDCIPSMAFYRCGVLTEVNLPDGLTEIGSFAFMDCHSLQQLQLPNGLKTIQTGAFKTAA